MSPPAHPLHPVNPDNACHPCITAAAGTELAVAYSQSTVSTGKPAVSSSAKGFYIPKNFFIHAALLRQAFAHCAIFLTAASHRSLGRISVPVWLIILSDQLPIVALVGRYPADKLMGRDLVPDRRSFQAQAMQPALNMRY